jgi:hypothetical protein
VEVFISDDEQPRALLFICSFPASASGLDNDNHYNILTASPICDLNFTPASMASNLGFYLEHRGVDTVSDALLWRFFSLSPLD